jgi:PKD repeat protein
MIIKWLWDFGDGFFSSEQNPSHTYTRPGIYTVSLTVWDNLGNSDTEIKTAYITANSNSSTQREKVCLRYATEKSEGEGWSEYSGASFLDPEDNWGVFPVLDEDGIPRTLVFDDNDQNCYEMDTYDRVSDLKSPALDKEGVSNAAIAWEWWLPEYVANQIREDAKLELDTSHLFIRPQDTENRGKTGYTASGLRSGLDISLEIYVDGEKATPSARLQHIQENAEVVASGLKLEFRRIQPVWKGTEGEVQITAARHDFIVKPKAASVSERTMDSHTVQLALATGKVFHVSRGKPLLLDRVTQRQIVGIASAAAGPDGRSGSAIATVGVTNFGNAAVAGNYTALIWVKSGVPFPAIAGWTQHGATTTGGWKLYYKISTGLPANLTLSAGEYFDIRAYSKHLTVDNIGDLYSDIVNYGGSIFLPGF